jgi:glyoxylase-like metal-dependent hydrolase (beta-lactamase superfamily II)
MTAVTRRLSVGAALAVLGAAAVSGQQPAAALRVLPVQGNVHLVVGAGVNVTVQVGRYGALLVDTPPPAAVPQLLAEVRKLTPRPVRFIINTSVNPEHIAGNAALTTPPGGGGRGVPFAFVGLNRPSIVAQENVLNRLANPPAGTPATAGAMLPTTTYYLPSMDFSNGEAVVLYHAPAAHTDSDSIVLFRESDVISTGAIFTPGRYPVIDLARGGSVTGLIAALGKVLELAVPDGFASGGTMIVPARGRISEETDVAEFRDMVAIIRDRVQDMVNRKMTLDEIRAARPSRDYDAEYGASQADADRFVESIYRSLTQPPPSGRRPS